MYVSQRKSLIKGQKKKRAIVMKTQRVWKINLRLQVLPHFPFNYLELEASLLSLITGARGEPQHIKNVCSTNLQTPQNPGNVHSSCQGLSTPTHSLPVLVFFPNISLHYRAPTSADKCLLLHVASSVSGVIWTDGTFMLAWLPLKQI